MSNASAIVVPRYNANATGYRISVQDLGEFVKVGRSKVRRQLRWLVTLRRNGGLIYQTKCMDTAESYGRAVIVCFARAETCRRLGMYCKAQVDIELARRAYAAAAALADTKLIAGG